jgi:uncharacterized protein with FMN-binding domain
MLKKSLISLAVVALFAFYTVQQRVHFPVRVSFAAGQMTVVAAAPRASSLNPMPLLLAGAIRRPGPPPPPPPGGYRDGTFRGDPANAYWGRVEVRISIAGGRIDTIELLDTPHTHPRSVTGNQRAMPILMREAMTAQRAKVDAVSGATDSSEAFMRSLDSALRQAVA